MRSLDKGPVKPIQWVKIANWISHVLSTTVLLYHFKLAWVVLPMTVEMCRFNLESRFESIVKISCSVLLNSYPKLCKIYFLFLLFLYSIGKYGISVSLHGMNEISSSGETTL